MKATNDIKMHLLTADNYIILMQCSMNFKYIECVVVILFTLLFCFSHLCWCDDLSSEYVV